MSQGDYGGQRGNMEDPAMAGTLECQARLIWPKEVEIVRRNPPESVLDVACGTGEILRRVREEFAPVRAVGIDLFPGHLHEAPRPVVLGDAFALPFPDQSFELVLVRHLLQALPDPVTLLKEARRVGRRVHLLVEDYAGILMDLQDPVAENHFTDVTPLFQKKGTDLYQGRRAYRHLREAGFSNVTVEPIIVDNLTGDREAFAGVFRHWKLGYAETLAGLFGVEVSEVERRFDLMIGTIKDPGRYAAWLLFVLTADS